jgi:hypothetical protein
VVTAPSKVVTLEFSAEIDQVDYAGFEADFIVNFDIEQTVYNGLLDTPENAFLLDAVAIEEIGDVAENITTAYDVLTDTYTIDMDVIDARFGTGIFTTLQTLGVKFVTIGGVRTEVISSNVSVFIAALEALIVLPVVTAPSKVVTLEFSAEIDQVDYAGFEADFIVNFDIE